MNKTAKVYLFIRSEWLLACKQVRLACSLHVVRRQRGSSIHVCSTFFSPQDGGIHSGEVENERSLAFSPRNDALREQTVTYTFRPFRNG